MDVGEAALARWHLMGVAFDHRRSTREGMIVSSRGARALPDQPLVEVTADT